MEHACSKCGTIVVDGLPFCPQCKSPQIRVLGFDKENLAVEAASSDDEARSPHRQPLPAMSLHGVQWHQALPAAAFGGLASIAGMFVPLGALGPAYALGGAVAVYVYRLRVRNTRLSSTNGAKIGAASGGFGFSILAIILMGAYVYHEDGLRKVFGDWIDMAVTRGSDPQVALQVHELLKTHEGLGALVAFLLSLFLLIFIVASSVGGALCASWLRRR